VDKRKIKGKVKPQKKREREMYFTPVGARSAPGLPEGMGRARDYLYPIYYAPSGWRAGVQNILQIKPSGSCFRVVPRPLAPPFELVFGSMVRTCELVFLLGVSS